MSAIRITVGAAKDRSVDDVLDSVVGAAKRARDKIINDAQRAAGEETRASKKSADESIRLAKEVEKAKERQFKQLERQVAQWQRDQARAEQSVAREAEKQQKAITRAHEQELKARMRAEREAAHESQRQAARAQSAIAEGERRYQRQRDAFIRSGVHGAGTLARGVLHGAVGLASAMGVDLSFQSQMGKVSEAQTLATQITNEAHQKGQTYANADDLAQQSLDIGTKTGTAGNDVLKGFQTFVGKTGDLTTAQDTMLELSKIAKGTGSSLEDVVSAAADVSNQLGDIPNKGEKVNQVMRVMAGEAKTGAVPMRALASQTAKIVASAQMFGGDVGQNMGTLGALAQEARLRGGAASPQQAATSITAFASVFNTKARLAAFRRAGINVDGANGKLGDINEIILASLQKTQKSTRSQSNEALNALYGGKLAAKSIGGYAEIFRSTYASTSGTEQEKLAAATAATRAEMDRLTNAAMDQKEVEDSFNRAMKTGESQANIWNNAVQSAATEMQGALLPAMTALTPEFVALTKGASDLITWMTGQQKKPSTEAVDADMEAVRAQVKAGKGVDKGLYDKSMKDVQKLGAEATDKENEARGLKEHRNLNVLAHGAKTGFRTMLDHPLMFLSGIGVLGGVASAAKSVIGGDAGKAADKEQKDAAAAAKDASDKAMNAFNELRHATLNVRVVASDVPQAGGGVGGQQAPPPMRSQLPAAHP